LVNNHLREAGEPDGQGGQPVMGFIGLAIFERFVAVGGGITRADGG
jgi:hypothetical protein